MLTKEYIENNEDFLREAIIKEALTYLGTPYHVLGTVKGAGVDCYTLILNTFYTIGLTENNKPVYYRPQFMMNAKVETYLNGFKDNGMFDVTGKGYKKADIILYKLGLCVSHAGIIIDDTHIIHASAKVGCIIDDFTQDIFKRAEKYVFSVWER